MRRDIGRFSRGVLVLFSAAAASGGERCYRWSFNDGPRLRQRARRGCRVSNKYLFQGGCAACSASLKLRQGAAGRLRTGGQQSCELSASVGKRVMRTDQAKERAQKTASLVSYRTLATPSIKTYRLT